jgi:hypothetical protein
MEDDELLVAVRLARGPEVTAEDLPLLRLVHSAYGAALDALLADEVAQLPLEPDLDPSRPPA